MKASKWVVLGTLAALGSVAAPALLVPSAALLEGAEGTRLAVVRPDRTVHLQTVKPGRDLGSEVEILEGLSGDERLVANPDASLQDGTRVEPVARAAG
jgi:membrane fusion protein, multidrug efflux system